MHIKIAPSIFEHNLFVKVFYQKINQSLPVYSITSHCCFWSSIISHLDELWQLTDRPFWSQLLNMKLLVRDKDIVCMKWILRLILGLITIAFLKPVYEEYKDGKTYFQESYSPWTVDDNPVLILCINTWEENPEFFSASYTIAYKNKDDSADFVQMDPKNITRNKKGLELLAPFVASTDPNSGGLGKCYRLDALTIDLVQNVARLSFQHEKCG